MKRRWRQLRRTMVEQVLIQWSGDPTLPPTWEDRVALQARFPAAEGWGQASSEGGGDVSIPDLLDPPDSNTNRREDTARPVRARKENRKYLGPSWIR